MKAPATEVTMYTAVAPQKGVTIPMQLQPQEETLNAIGYRCRTDQTADGFRWLGDAPNAAIKAAAAALPTSLDAWLRTDLNTIPGLKASLTAPQWSALVQRQKDLIDKRRTEEMLYDPPDARSGLQLLFAKVRAGNLAAYDNKYDAVLAAWPYPTAE